MSEICSILPLRTIWRGCLESEEALDQVRQVAATVRYVINSISTNISATRRLTHEHCILRDIPFLARRDNDCPTCRPRPQQVVVPNRGYVLRRHMSQFLQVVRVMHDALGADRFVGWRFLLSLYRSHTHAQGGMKSLRLA